MIKIEFGKDNELSKPQLTALGMMFMKLAGHECVEAPIDIKKSLELNEISEPQELSEFIHDKIGDSRGKYEFPHPLDPRAPLEEIPSHIHQSVNQEITDIVDEEKPLITSEEQITYQKVVDKLTGLMMKNILSKPKLDEMLTSLNIPSMIQLQFHPDAVKQMWENIKDYE